MGKVRPPGRRRRTWRPREHTLVHENFLHSAAALGERLREATHVDAVRPSSSGGDCLGEKSPPHRDGPTIIRTRDSHSGDGARRRCRVRDLHREDPFLQCYGTGLACNSSDKCAIPTAPCGATGFACCTTGQPCTGSGATCTSNMCEVPPPPCSTQGSTCCSGKCAASSGLECKSNKCVAPPSPPPDPPGCGQIGAPAYPCCHNKANACDLNGVCDSYGNCEPAGSSSGCNARA